MRTAAAALYGLALWATCASATAPSEGMIELTLRGQKLQGTPLWWGSGEVHLLGRDGRLWEFRPEEARHFRKSASHFFCYTPAEFRGELLRELGEAYEVTGTGHYLVAHPRGQGDCWSDRFEDLYRSFVQYFSVRGFRPTAPPFPLVGIVCRDHDDFARYSAGEGIRASRGLMGYYHPQSNRIIVFDTGASRNGEPWKQTASVLIHEATHQTAFNTGVHSRYAPPPTWVAEGLATMFEAPGVYNAREHTEASERVNRMRLNDFRTGVVPQHRPELLAAVVASDKLFAANPGAAYAEAWALSFFLMETEPRKYAKYLALTAAREPFSDYSAGQRTADFAAVFGGDWRMLEARMLRFIAGIK